MILGAWGGWPISVETFTSPRRLITLDLTVWKLTVRGCRRAYGAAEKKLSSSIFLHQTARARTRPPKKICPRASPFLVWLAYSQPLTNLPPPTMGCCAKVVSSTMSGVLGRKRADELGYPPSHWNQEPLLVKIRKEHPGWAWGEQVRGLWFFPSVLWLGDRKGIPLENIMSVGYVGGDDLTGALHVLQLQSSSPSPSSLLQGSPE